MLPTSVIWIITVFTMRAEEKYINNRTGMTADYQQQQSLKGAHAGTGADIYALRQERDLKFRNQYVP